MNKTKIAVAMSGGVDSSVAAALLLDKGYDIVGVTIKMWSNDNKDSGNNQHSDKSKAVRDA